MVLDSFRISRGTNLYSLVSDRRTCLSLKLEKSYCFVEVFLLIYKNCGIQHSYEEKQTNELETIGTFFYGLLN